MKKFKMLFVCTGNTCRSPMAEYLMRKTLEDRGLGDRAAVRSAGTHAFRGDSMAAPAQELLAVSYGAEAWNHEASRVSGDLLAGQDLILTMTGSQASQLTEQWPDFASRIYTLAEAGIKARSELSGIIQVIPPDARLDIPDPYGQSREVYAETAELLLRYLEPLADWLAHELDGEKPEISEEI